MTHSFIITTEEREKVTKLIEAASTFHEMSWKIEDYSLVTTEDECLSAILDQVITNKVEAIVTTKAPAARKPAQYTEQPSGKKLPHCRRCHVEYKPKGFEKLCPKCTSDSKSDHPWKIVGTDERLSHLEMNQRLVEGKLPIGTGLVHDSNGTYEVVDNGKKLVLDRVME